MSLLPRREDGVVDRARPVPIVRFQLDNDAFAFAFAHWLVNLWLLLWLQQIPTAMGVRGDNGSGEW